MDVIGQTTSYLDPLEAAGHAPDGHQEAALAIAGDQDAIERALESIAASPGGAALGGLMTNDYRKANLQVQMKEGDNKAMESVVESTRSYLRNQPLPDGIRTAWAGETYLNLVWQDKMVSGMLKAFLSTFAVVFVLMVLLLRSLRWAILAMAPMSLTILVVYGVVGYGGKDYDMPMAVVSTLVLGIGVDFAIHLVVRYRELAAETRSSAAALARFFEEPARALTRNALIIAIGFVPLFFASLVPYIVVGAFLASIMLLSWLVTLVLLPALITLFRREERGTPVKVKEAGAAR